MQDHCVREGCLIKSRHWDLEIISEDRPRLQFKNVGDADLNGMFVLSTRFSFLNRVLSAVVCLQVERLTELLINVLSCRRDIAKIGHLPSNR